MRIKHTFHIVIVCACIVSTCGARTIPSHQHETENATGTAVFDRPFFRVFVSLIEVFHSAGYSLDNADELRGVVSTQWKEERIGFFSRRDIRKKVSAKLENIGEHATQVTLKYAIENKTEYGWAEGTIASYESKQFYRKCFNQIERKLSD
jgi:hypothetical protein